MLRAQPYATCDSIERVIGTVVVETPGTKRLVPLTSRLGTIVDTANSTVQLTCTADTHGAYRERALLLRHLPRYPDEAQSLLCGGRAVGITVLSLEGRLPNGCGPTGTKGPSEAPRPLCDCCRKP